MKHDLKKICHKVREALLEYDKKTEKIGPSLGGYCAIASFVLCRCFAKIGLRPKLMELINDDRCSHCWVELNGKRFDVTATQFGNYPKILVGTKRSKHVKMHIKKFPEADSVSYKRYSYWEDWHMGPTPEIIKDIFKIMRKNEKL